MHRPSFNERYNSQTEEYYAEYTQYYVPESMFSHNCGDLIGLYTFIVSKCADYSTFFINIVYFID